VHEVCGEAKEAMNRAFYIILVPVLLVVLGYAVVFHSMGISPGYWRLIVAVVAFFGALWWLGRKTGRKTGSIQP
jgi:ABC-type spermidine/putrescine transport system permease subunit II